MGVPAFFRWLSKKFPSIVVEAPEDVPIDYPFDNFYLDMNGIIHPCTHPENKAPPETEQDMFEAIFEYIDRLMKMVRPRKLLYMAVDGVAPRAKMNQQRSRRFRASKESIEKKIEVQKIKDDLKDKGYEVYENPDRIHFDSNVITPGTDFMLNLSRALCEWVDKKLSGEEEDPDGLWHKDLVVILSDASVPGEGEHKVIDYIRRQKAVETYDPNLSHCLCGADADLIHLGLSLHELNFTILREEFIPNQPRPCDICNQMGHEMKDCEGMPRNLDDTCIEKAVEPGFIFIRLNVLREYLARECGDQLDLERFIDDFVFLCFFVGNDFLPHLPSLEIREGAIDRLMILYKKIMSNPSSTTYMTENGFVNLNRVQLLLNDLGRLEDEIFRKRKVNDARYKKNQKRQKLMQNKPNAWWDQPKAVGRGGRPDPYNNPRQEAYNVRVASRSENLNAAQRLKAMLKGDEEQSNEKPRQEFFNNDESSLGQKRKREDDEDDTDSEPEDNIQLGTDGWKDRYYYHKFGCAMHTNISRKIADEYVRGLCWVLRYYYQGCPDWQWFYPYHYAPFASDFKNIKSLEIKFNEESKPFRPLEQLMSVFPSASSSNLPPTWRKLMCEKDSPIIDFYPMNFKVDLNGKKAAWMGVALLPFIDETRLFVALEDVYPFLDKQEKRRNKLGCHLFFISKNKTNSNFIEEIIEKKEKDPVELDPNLFDKISGMIKPCKNTKKYNKSICIEYYDPGFPKDYVFKAQKLDTAIPPPDVLKPEDFEDHWKPYVGMNRLNQEGRVGDAGKRMLGHSMNQGKWGQNTPQMMPNGPQHQHRFQPHYGHQSNQQYQQAPSFPPSNRYDSPQAPRWNQPNYYNEQSSRSDNWRK